MNKKGSRSKYTYIIFRVFSLNIEQTKLFFNYIYGFIKCMCFKPHFIRNILKITLIEERYLLSACSLSICIFGTMNEMRYNLISSFFK